MQAESMDREDYDSLLKIGQDFLDTTESIGGIQISELMVAVFGETSYSNPVKHTRKQLGMGNHPSLRLYSPESAKAPEKVSARTKVGSAPAAPVWTAKSASWAGKLYN
ncbi:hypothetical protein B0H17DRAFT_1197573 [Mycena rosella]|uniref:Uncharacterized protein n=1 Tax=Mycena rosella TaxID=1033263 RepID=A0AAD7DRA1_MYCRO|nr:hypothetical protein B0H17DRAFT_1197573 [Mycena rosella]